MRHVDSLPAMATRANRRRLPEVFQDGPVIGPKQSWAQLAFPERAGRIFSAKWIRSHGPGTLDCAKSPVAGDERRSPVNAALVDRLTFVIMGRLFTWIKTRSIVATF